jgi:hypothetical protein
MSRNVLRGKGPHTYFDDLESFYYVLAWLLASFHGPGAVSGTSKNPVPGYVEAWDGPSPFFLKHGQFAPLFELPVDPWFGTSLRHLALQLHLFFVRRSDLIGKPLSSLDPAKDYDEFLGHIRECIAELEKEGETKEMLSSQPRQRSSGPEAGSPDATRTRDRQMFESNSPSTQADHPHRTILRIRTGALVFRRPERSTANYRGSRHTSRRRQRKP